VGLCGCMSIHSVCVFVCVGTYLVEASLDQIGTHTHTHTHTHTQTERIDIQPHTHTPYNEYKSTFQFSNIAMYGHGPLEDGFKGDRNM
jgi:hypothetical protein